MESPNNVPVIIITRVRMFIALFPTLFYKVCLGLFEEKSAFVNLYI